MDFYQIKQEHKKDSCYIYPDFKVCRSKDLMIRGKSFYAIWDEQQCLWSTDEYDVQRLVDQDLRNRLSTINSENCTARLLSDFSSNSWTQFRNYITHISDNYHELDEKLVFSNTKIEKKDYCSRRLTYPLEEGPISAYDKLMSTLYDPDERAKLEWAIGSIIAGDSVNIQKFIVLYGSAGAGKSTVLNIIQKLFDGYYTTFDAKSLAGSSNAFATEAFKSNPLVAIQHDGDLSRIEDNTKINSIVAHEEIVINEKYKSSYPMRIRCFLFMGTNKPVKITDAKSGIIRRLIDVRPSGRKLPPKEYENTMSCIDFELGHIAYHCLQVYKKMGKSYYSTYRPVDMMYKTDPFFNFVEDHYLDFTEKEGISLRQAYSMYKDYCDETNADYKLQMYKFREELKNYFIEFHEIYTAPTGERYRNYYTGFLKDKFIRNAKPVTPADTKSPIDICEQESLFDSMAANWPAQYATEEETPTYKWDNVKTTLKDLDTKKLHYVKVPDNHIIIDFDIKDENGNKSLEKNLEAASKFPPTYAELSKSGKGVHLHYIYTGDDIDNLSAIYEQDIEVKRYKGNSSLRRKLVKCNALAIATISSGLPLKKKGANMVDIKTLENEKHLRTMICKNLAKECLPSTKSSMDFIKKLMDEAYESGMHYDVSDMRNAIFMFATRSTHQSQYCVNLLDQMKWHSIDISDNPDNTAGNTILEDDRPIVFFDIEVFPNLLLVKYKFQGKGKPIMAMFNPTSDEVRSLFKHKLVGFNCRGYDNHILWARALDYDNDQIFKLSQRIISGDRNAKFAEAYNLSYADIYDFSSKKQSLKKFEIELGIHHLELGLPWDKPVPKELWPKVSEYCDNDVISTEAVWENRHEDFVARQILADLSGLSVNDSSRSHSTRIIFGKEKNPQKLFNYRNLALPVDDVTFGGMAESYEEFCKVMNKSEFRVFDDKGQPTYTTYDPSTKLPAGYSLLPYFPGYEYKNGKSTYKGYKTGEGGVAEGIPGYYILVGLLDIASMHPTSLEEEWLFGPYTKNFQDIKRARIYIKHKEYDKARKLFNGRLAKYLDDEDSAEALAQALKIVINSVYGYTKARFENPFVDPRNVDNIVAKRGALFMINLREQIEARGFTVAHVKTDSVKIPNATPEIIQFVMDYGKEYGYIFEHEATYEKMVLVNDAVYIAKYSNATYNKHPGEWTATGTEFQVPYVFKKLFSNEKIEFEDLTMTFSTSSALYLDHNYGYPDDTVMVKELAKITKIIKKAEMLNETIDISMIAERDRHTAEISKCHNYKFVGKVGLFVPVKPEYEFACGLYRIDETGKAYNVGGTTGYRWAEAETIRSMDNYMKYIDISYFAEMAQKAKEHIEEYVDYDTLINETVASGTTTGEAA